MFNIGPVTASTASVLIGGPPGKAVVGASGPLGPEGAFYTLNIAGLGYISFLDQGSKVSGPGSWSIKVSGSSTNWFYNGEGQAKVVVDSSGNYTITGGSNTISGKVTAWA